MELAEELILHSNQPLTIEEHVLDLNDSNCCMSDVSGDILSDIDAFDIFDDVDGKNYEPFSSGLHAMLFMLVNSPRPMVFSITMLFPIIFI